MPKATANPTTPRRRAPSVAPITPPDTSRERQTDNQVIAAAQGYRRTPSHFREWAKVADYEFPIFGLAEVMLEEPDERLADAWRAHPKESRDLAVAFYKTGLRWIAGAEAMFAMWDRMKAAMETTGIDTKDFPA